MDERLRAAAERYRNNSYPPQGEGWGSYYLPIHGVADADMLAHAYLAEHPADGSGELDRLRAYIARLEAAAKPFTRNYVTSLPDSTVAYPCVVIGQCRTLETVLADSPLK